MTTPPSNFTALGIQPPAALGGPRSVGPFNQLRALATIALSLAVLATPSLVRAQEAPPGPYPPAAGQPGSDAIPGDASAFLAWADGWVNYLPGREVNEIFRTPAQALGPAQLPFEAGGSYFNIVTLGKGGEITLTFRRPIADGEGPDFAVFENAINDGFLELAFVEVSSDGENFFRFPNQSLTAEPQGAYSSEMEASDLHGFAGKYRLGYGTPFDLADLPDDPALDKMAVRFVRLIDIIGDGLTLDSTGNPIYDPYPTVGSAGFDLDAIGALNLAPSLPLEFTHFEVTPDQTLRFRWEGHAWFDYTIESSSNLLDWHPLHTQPGLDGRNEAELPLPATSSTEPHRWLRLATP